MNDYRDYLEEAKSVPEDHVWDGEAFISPEDFHARFEEVEGEWVEREAAK